MVLEVHRCACSLGKAVGDKNQHNFSRVGLAHNILYKGWFIIRHRTSGREAIISRPNEGKGICAEADTCCFDWFEGGTPTKGDE